MGFDWFTFVALIVNFLILVFLLKHFLYGRIIRAMDEREEKLIARMEEAEQKKKEADKEAKALREERRQLAEKKEEILAGAKEDADQRKRKMIETAREETSALRSKWRQAIDHEKTSFLKELRQRASREVYASVRQILRDLADEALEQKIVDLFIKRIRSLEEDEREAVLELIRKSGGPLVVSTAFEITDAKREQVRDAIQREFSDHAEIRFEISEDTICGIVLEAAGRKVAWNVEAYLQDLEETAARLLEEEVEKESIEEL
jgi:F-type H+-transporting ATPase subunit b